MEIRDKHRELQIHLKCLTLFRRATANISTTTSLELVLFFWIKLAAFKYHRQLSELPFSRLTHLIYNASKTFALASYQPVPSRLPTTTEYLVYESTYFIISPHSVNL
jgi:hypothetical protein